LATTLLDFQIKAFQSLSRPSKKVKVARGLERIVLDRKVEERKVENRNLLPGCDSLLTLPKFFENS
jgi:hypothetical protein